MGNNVLLMHALGCRATGTFFDWKGVQLGLTAEVEFSRQDLVERVSRAVGGPVHLCPGGSEEVRKIGIVTGGAGA